MGPRLRQARRGRGGAPAPRDARSRDRRHPGDDERRRRAYGDGLRAFRRPAAGAARPVGVAAVRAAGARRLALRARDRRRQGAALYAAEGGAADARGELAARQHPDRLRRRGGDRRALDRRLPRGGRPWRRRLRHLRRRPDAAGTTGVRARDTRAGRVPRHDAYGRPRHALGLLRRCGVECDPRTHAGIDRAARARRSPTRAAARRGDSADRRGEGELRAPADGRADPRRRRCDGARSEGAGGVLRADVGRAVARRQRHLRRQA